MSSAQTAVASSQNISLPRAEYDALQAQVQTLQTQLDWFKRQLFGAKSEKRLEIDPAMQADLLAALGEDFPAHVKPETEKIIYERRKSRSDKTVTDTGLRFDDSVPVETIVLSSPKLADVPEDEQVLITEKITYRLAQRPGSYVVLKYVRPVIKRKDTNELVTPPVPVNVLDKSIADVSFLAGTLVDKFLPQDPSERDLSSMRDAYDDFHELTRRYPNSKYYLDSAQRMVHLRNNMAQYELHVADFYMRRGAFIAAANRAEYVVENFQRTPAVPEALVYMVRAYNRLGSEDLASDALRVLELNYPDHPALPALREGRDPKRGKLGIMSWILGSPR